MKTCVKKIPSDWKKRRRRRDSEYAKQVKSGAAVKCDGTNLRWDRDSVLSTLLERLSLRLRLWLRLRLRRERTEEASAQLSPLTPPPTGTCCVASPAFLMKCQKQTDDMMDEPMIGLRNRDRFAPNRKSERKKRLTNGKAKGGWPSMQHPRSCRCRSYCIHPQEGVPLKKMSTTGKC